MLNLGKQEIVEKYVRAYNGFRLDDMAECLTEQCIFENVSNFGNSITTVGKEEFRKLAEQSKDIFKTRKQVVKNWIISETHIAIEIDYLAELAVDLPNGLKAGQELKLRGVSIFQFEGSKICRLADYS